MALLHCEVVLVLALAGCSRANPAFAVDAEGGVGATGDPAPGLDGSTGGGAVSGSGGGESGGSAPTTSPPESCGNGSLDSDEQCDGVVMDANCAMFGFDDGLVRCDPTCQFDASGCSSCGDDQVTGAEECDSDAAIECAAIGWDAGEAACDACALDQSECCNFIGTRCAVHSDCCEGFCVATVCSVESGSSTGMAGSSTSGSDAG